jgi:phospholipid-translocating ATPase
LLLLHAKTENGTCHIKTANLDGETNLKQRTVPYDLQLIENENDLTKLRGVISCEKPNPRLYEFKGTLTMENHLYSLSNENILLRGASLKVAPAAYGCVIYAGQDSKMMMNSKYQSNKLSCVERFVQFKFLY